MKCPKCGFNSFEYYDSCKKCSSDLTGYKQTYSITSMVLPQEARESLVAEFKSAESEAEQIGDAPETHDDIFSFDLPDEPPPLTIERNDDPFNFDEPATAAAPAVAVKAEEDVFADLLETTPQVEDSPFAAPRQPAAPVAAVQAPDFSAAPGEFDLESFSWDETPPVAAASAPAEAPDDFDSLFGDAKENSSK